MVDSFPIKKLKANYMSKIYSSWLLLKRPTNFNENNSAAQKFFSPIEKSSGNVFLI